MKLANQPNQNSVSCKVRVTNDLGLHTRPATVIVRMLQHVRCDCSFTHKKETINAKSILSILMLAARKNSVITITCTGVDAQETLDKLVEAFKTNFGE